MLRPKDTATRERKVLGGLWRFALDTDGAGRAEGWWDRPLPGNKEVPVPASYNDVFADAAVRNHVGDVWYQTVVRVPARWAGERIVLRFDAATHWAVVWVNGVRVTEHEGGYTPFEADVTGVVEPGSENRLTAVVNNVLTWQSIPPGYVEQTQDGPRQRLLFDFFNYAGLHRQVWLYTTPASYVSDVTVVTGLSGSTGTVGYEVETAGDERPEVRVALRDADGDEVARAIGASGELAIEDVRPWRPGEGYLYELTVELWGGGHAPVDAYSQAVGVRTV
jgi:beta-glucuronidase